MKVLALDRPVYKGVFMLLILLLAVNVTLAAPVASYTYNYWGKAMPGPDAYLPEKIITGEMLNVGAFKAPQDIFVISDQIFILDSGNNRIIKVDKNLKNVKIIKDFVHEGKIDGFNNPTGIFIKEDGKIYVADYKNRRVVVLSADGKFITQIEGPKGESYEAIPEDFVFQPLKVTADRAGRVYVIAQGIYDGIMEFDEKGEFKGFLGAPRVTPDMTDYLWRKFVTREQRKRMALILPTEYSNFDIDERGFIYATVSGGAMQKKEAVRRLNPGGKDVLRRTGFFPPIGDIDYPLAEVVNATYTGPSVFIDIVKREQGIYSVLDQKRGRIFTYDANGNLLYTFGGLGNQKGLFIKPIAIEALDDKILVLDSDNQQITVFDMTDYAKNIHQAIKLYNKGKYDLSTKCWEEVLKSNSNYDLAYSGIGRSLISQKNYKKAMENYRLGSDRQGYSEALRLYRRQVINDNFNSLMTFVIIILASIYIAKKSNLVKKLTEKVGLCKRKGSFIDSLKYALYVILHPFDGFWDLKYEKRGNVKAATVILGGVCLTYVFMHQYTGFIFNHRDLNRLNVYMEFISVLLPFFLWCGVNWSLTTLMEGKGTFKDIYIASAYGLTPIILVNIPLTILSNFITLEEGAFYYFFLVVGLLWALSLVFFGNMVTHHYTVKKTLFTTLLSIIGMGIVIFIGLLFFSVIAQMIGFIETIYIELAYRL